MSRWRVQLRIAGQIRWLSHLDILSLIERGMRRAQLPVAYSEGFNPHMLISWGPAHPVGLAGDSEYFDLDFTEVPANGWIGALNGLLPQGTEVVAARELKEKTQALMSIINRAEYRIAFSSLDEEELDLGVAKILSAVALPVVRKSPKGDKTVDIRPGILSLKREGSELILFATLATGNSPKPHEVAKSALPSGRVAYLLRSGMMIENNGKLMKP